MKGFSGENLARILIERDSAEKTVSEMEVAVEDARLELNRLEAELYEAQNQFALLDEELRCFVGDLKETV